MTPKKAAAVSKRIDVMCDEPFMFACKVGSGCHASCKGKRDPQDYLTMILELIDGVFDRLPPRQQKNLSIGFCWCSESIWRINAMRKIKPKPFKPKLRRDVPIIFCTNLVQYQMMWQERYGRYAPDSTVRIDLNKILRMIQP